MEDPPQLAAPSDDTSSSSSDSEQGDEDWDASSSDGTEIGEQDPPAYGSLEYKNAFIKACIARGASEETAGEVYLRFTQAQESTLVSSKLDVEHLETVANKIEAPSDVDDTLTNAVGDLSLAEIKASTTPVDSSSLSSLPLPVAFPVLDLPDSSATPADSRPTPSLSGFSSAAVSSLPPLPSLGAAIPSGLAPIVPSVNRAVRGLPAGPPGGFFGAGHAYSPSPSPSPPPTSASTEAKTSDSTDAPGAYPSASISRTPSLAPPSPTPLGRAGSPQAIGVVVRPQVGGWNDAPELIPERKATPAQATDLTPVGRSKGRRVYASHSLSQQRPPAAPASQPPSPLPRARSLSSTATP
ncbi:hypothetical protein P7C70_g7492, partial [Phenoliferia sp. Uapishka_3]